LVFKYFCCFHFQVKEQNIYKQLIAGIEMKKEKIAILFLGLLLSSAIISVLLISSVRAADSGFVPAPGNNRINIPTSGGTLAGAFDSIFTKSGWLEGNFAPNIAKIFFFIMIGLFVFLILSNVFGSFSKGILGVISFLVAFLATAYMTPDEVYSLLNSYSALGLTITTLIPLIILGGLTYTAETAEKGQVQLIMMQYFGWILFAAYSVYRLGYDMFSSTGEGSIGVNVILLVTAIVAAGVAVWNKQLRRMIAKNYIESSKEAAEETLLMGTEYLKSARKAQEAAAGTRKGQLGQ
jgi:hypothetical protein